METNFSGSEQPKQLIIDDISKSYLHETARWGFFLGIMGFIGTGLMVVFGIFYSSIFSSIPMPNNGFSPNFGVIMSIVYVGIAAIYFFPSMYLFKYSKRLKIAIEISDSLILTEAFSNQKSLFKFMGIFTIIMLSLYAIMIFGMFVGIGLFS